MFSYVSPFEDGYGVFDNLDSLVGWFPTRLEAYQLTKVLESCQSLDMPRAVLLHGR